MKPTKEEMKYYRMASKIVSVLEQIGAETSLNSDQFEYELQKASSFSNRDGVKDAISALLKHYQKDN